MRVIGISGLWCYDDPVWRTVGPAFEQHFDCAFMAEEFRALHLLQINRMRRFVSQIVEKYDDGAHTLLVGHSMGGVFACAVAERMKRTSLLGIVSVFAPQRFPIPRLWSLIGDPQTINVPIITFCAKRDEGVWWGSRHPRSKCHTKLECDYFKDISNDPSFAMNIARITKRELFV
jgi:pimeloyl-ACP methyl ester carboxylesterase